MYDDQYKYKRFKRPLKWSIVIGGVVGVAVLLFTLNLIFPVVTFGRVVKADATQPFEFIAVVSGEFNTKKEAMHFAMGRDCHGFLYHYDGKWLVIDNVIFDIEKEHDKETCRHFKVESMQIALSSNEQVEIFKNALGTFSSIATLLEKMDNSVDAETIVNDINVDYVQPIKEISLQIENILASRSAPQVFCHLFYAMNMQLLYLIDLMSSQNEANFNCVAEYTVIAITFTLFDLLTAL